MCLSRLPPTIREGADFLDRLRLALSLQGQPSVDGRSWN
ncbi:hypothetical protein J3E64_001325 [Sphingobium sp. OAS761]|nr:hypothetical protein [Sphingobium sp. OAS761]